MIEKKTEQAYMWEEVFSLDRMKRAMTTRILDQIEAMCEGDEPVSPEQISTIIKQEWQRVKEAVRSSPAAKEAFRKYLENTISGEIDTLIEADRTELQSMGVVERNL